MTSENKMVIEVNNGRTIEFEPCRFGVKVHHKNSEGVEDRHCDRFTDGEIVAALNLLSYMKDNDLGTAYLFNNETRRYLDNLLRHGDIEEFIVFQ